MASLRQSEIVAVVGAGTMGAGIAQVAASAGHTVLLFDIQENAAAAAVERIDSATQRLIEKKRITRSDQEQMIQRINPVGSLDELKNASIVIEVVLERLEVKQDLFSSLEDICGESTIFATNTSSISITAIGRELRNPERLVGMHFFNPAPIMKLVEVISGLLTSPAVAETVFLSAKKWGKEPVHAKSTPGFIVNRVARPFYAEALRAVQEGAATFATVDTVLKEAGGFRMGPFELMDLIGNDVNYSVTESVYNAYYQDRRFTPSLIQKGFVDAGLFGRKSGAGFYNYQITSKEPEPKKHCERKCVKSVVVSGDLGIAQSLVTLAEERSIKVLKGSGNGYIQVGKATLALTDGRLATIRSQEDRLEDLVVFDLAIDFASTKRIAIAPSDQASNEALKDAISFFEALGKKISVIDDSPGLIVMRTLAMLVNEGSDAVLQGVCTSLAVDQAMKAGLNYPLGPLEWGQRVGLDYILKVLDNLEGGYGDGRYRSSLLLQRKACSSQLYYQPA